MTFRYTHLLPLVALVMLMASAPAFAQTDYDSDNDNYIEVSTHAQLNAIRWDLDGNGIVSSTDSTAYFTAFSGTTTPNTATGMGCAATCVGYELSNDIELADGSGSNTWTSADTYYNGGNGWDRIGSDASASTRYQGDFNGNGYTINNLYINRATTNDQGLFGSTHSSSRIEDLGITNANITGQHYTGILAGNNRGIVIACYTTGSVSGSNTVGGLIGYSDGGSVSTSYSTASVSGTGTQVGGLIGSTRTDVTNSYSIGSSSQNNGGLVAVTAGGASASNSYWDATASGNGGSAVGTSQTTAELQSPTTYTGIFANWNIDLDGDRLPDNPWNFGTSSQYPTLNTPTQRAQVIDYDQDDDGLIDIQSLDQLNAIRYDLNGDGAPTDTIAYAAAFPAGQLAGSASTRMGCTANCTGYELLNDLDFDTDGSGTVTSADAYPNWSPIGTFSATFNGRGHTISNLTISQTGTSNVGLFSHLGSGGSITSVGLLNPSVSNGGGTNIGTGSLVGYSQGPISASYATGGNVNSSADNAQTGGLVGRNSSTITASYATCGGRRTGRRQLGLRLDSLQLRRRYH